MDNAPRHLVCVPVPNARYFNLDNAALNRQLSNVELLATAYVGQDPASYAKAMRSANADQWVEACQYEMDALHKNDTWELVNLPAGYKAVKLK